MGNETINVINKIINVLENLNAKLKADNPNFDVISKDIDGIPKLFSVMQNIISDEIYVDYQEFFRSFSGLCKSCNQPGVLKNNVLVFGDSVELAIECLDSIGRKINEENNYINSIEMFMEGVQLVNAKEGFRLFNASGHNYIKLWIDHNCPQVICVDGSIENIFDKYDFIICGSNSGDAETINKLLKDNLYENGIIITDLIVEGDDYYTYVVSNEGVCDLYVISKDENFDFDLSYNWLIQEDLCNNGPKVSVLMSCYNHERFVEDAILSVINQSYKNIELIISDDASPDNTAAIIKKYEKHYAKCIYFKENGGGRTNELKKYATGKYIAIMHSDDVWHNDKLALQVEYMENHPECGACLSWCKYIDINDNILDDNIFIQPNRDRKAWMRFFWENGNVLCNPSSLTRIEYFYDRDWLGITGRQLPDYFKWIDSVQKFDIHIIAKELIYMRRYKLEGVENTSIESNQNTFNSHIEMGASWVLCLKYMDDDFFKSTFGRYFRNDKASTKEELICEKYFLLLEHTSPFVQHSAYQFYNENYATIKDCMKNTYNYRLPDYRNDVRTKGLMDFFKDYI